MRHLCFVTASVLLAAQMATVADMRRQEQSGAKQPPVWTLLDRYDDHGDIALIREVAAGDLSRFAQEFAAAAGPWMSAAGSAAVERRRLVVAAFVLELAQLVVEMHQSERVVADVHRDDGWIRRWRSLRALIEWACALIRSSPSRTVAESLWFAASFDLLELAQDHLFLYGPTAQLTLERAIGIDEEFGRSLNHLGHGLSRFPAHASFRLLQLEGGAELWHMVAYWVATGTAVSRENFKELQAEASAIRARRTLRTGSRHPSDATVLRRADFLTELSAVRARIESLEAGADVAAKVSLDLGLISLCFANPAQALRYFSRVESATDDRNLIFLARFLQGWIHGRQGDPVASEAAYRSAVSLRPDSQSATLALAEILFMTARRREAIELVGRAVALPSDTDVRLRPRDPWLEFANYGRLTSGDSMLALRRAIF